MIYLLILALLLVLALYHDFGRSKRSAEFQYWMAYIVLVSLSGLRYKVGGDTYNYMYAYDFLPSLGQLFDADADAGIAKFQPLWLLLSALAKTVSKEFFVFQILHAIIVNLVIFLHIRKNTKYKFTAVLFYYSALYPYLNFEILREALAICVFILAFDSYNAGRWRNYYLLVAVAFFFHQSAFFLMFLPLMKRVNIKVGMALVVFFFSAILNSYVLDFIGTSSVVDLFATAADYKNYKYTYFGLASLLVLYVSYPATVIYVAEAKLRVNSEYYNLARKALLIGALTPLLFIFFRFFNYFSLFFVVLAAEVLHGLVRAQSLKRFWLLVLPLTFLFFLVFYTGRYFSDQSEYVSSARWYSYWYPYYSIFEESTDPIREQLIDATRQ